MRVLFAIVLGTLPEKWWHVEDSTRGHFTSIVRHYDEETGMVCYLMPSDRCAGPAISCVRVK